ncbi:hypothetical protein CI109_104128 [Kwoniella shandongensis]|uniref:Uncharacterized protein n=1 Tax=Kwoniella shandongensis TaxID=1734106 RepID=A0A5M6C6J9_9TREE|nr:uncharacterized protein CI109_002959 [Kwoniella shandongensis]KAA5528799.1 hypothetical protein CI109_002959 [Kwoniella shandongensis]
MTDHTPTEALKSLRAILRTANLSLDDLSFHLSSTTSALYIHPTSIPPTHIPQSDIQAIGRYLPSIQAQILSDIVPTFLGALDSSSEASLRNLFVPSKSVDTLSVRRAIALTSYLNLPTYLNNPSPNDGQALPTTSRSFLLLILEGLTKEYGIDDLYYATFTASNEKGEGLKTLQWEDSVRSVVGIPAKAANAVGRWKSDGANDDLPEGLIPKVYFDRLANRLEGLMYELSQESGDVSALQLVIEKLAAIGLLTPRPSLNPSPTPSLLPALLPPLLAHLHPSPSSPIPPYPATFLPSVFLPLPSSTLATFVDSVVQHLTLQLVDGLLEPDLPDQRIKRAVQVLEMMIGSPKVGSEAWAAVMRSVLGNKQSLRLSDNRQEARNRLIAGWVALGGESSAKAFIEAIIEAWSDPKYVKFTLYAQQLNLTHTLLLALSLIQPFSPWLVAMSHRSRLILAFQSYLSHSDPSIRRLGMLVAEVLSELTIEETEEETPRSQTQEEIEALKKGLEVDENGEEDVPKQGKASKVKRLKFRGLWDGIGEGKEECRWLRRVVGTQDGRAVLDDEWEGWLLGWHETHATTPSPSTEIPAPASRPTESQSRGRTSVPRKKAAKESKPKVNPKIVMLDPDQLDDPLEGYASDSPSSSRSPSPTPSYLEEVAADPSLALDAADKKKVSRPVYVPQLFALLKGREKPEYIEMGLKWGEGLVRAKREFGTELAENSVSVTLMALGLNDPFNIEGFEEKRQGLMNALVACSPKDVAPFLCEQYFNTQYSLQQKSVILTALAMGARELAGMSVPLAPTTNRRIDFPTKTLPPSLHQKYISAADLPKGLIEGSERGQLDEAIDGVRNLLLSKGARKGEESVPEIAREKRLRVSATRRTMVAEVGSMTAQQMSLSNSTANRPVVPFKDIAAEYFMMPLINRFWQHFQDSSTRESRAITSGTRYRGAGTGMILSPMALEKFLMTLSLLLHAARYSPMFLAILCPETLELAVTIGARHPSRTEDDPLSSQGGSTTEASVVGAALELCLVALDGSFDLDSGRTLALDKPALLMGVGEWATTVFKLEEVGGEVAGGQGGKREGRVKAGAAGVVLKVGEIAEKWGHMGLRF